jgi:hypothetical protein
VKSSLHKWLIKTFGKQEAKTALIITGIALCFFILIMSFFRVVIVMNLLYGDSNRVLGDFTEVSANHYRIKVHPFYVLFWQTLYHMICPIVDIKNSIAIRILIAIFASLNIGLFSLFITRLTKSKILNIIVCGIMIFSFPQIYQGGQMLESFIFTQTSILITILYFSFALTDKCKYNLPTLLALSLFVGGNNIAYICIFGILYLFLLFASFNSWVERLKKASVFIILFIFFFSVLLVVQRIIYGSSAPSNIVFMVLHILSEEKTYITTKYVSWIKYIMNFFNVLLFEEFPFGIGNITGFGWIWSVLLLLPFIFVNRIINRRLFFATSTSCAFLFVFHRFYGVTELALYSPVLSSMYLCLFAFIVQILPKKISIFIGGMLLSVIVFFNSFGTYNMHRINQFVFGTVDIGNWQDYQDNIEKIKVLLAESDESKIVLYRALRE